jgi:hypothetical protein
MTTITISVRLAGAVDRHQHSQLLNPFYQPDGLEGSGLRKWQMKLKPTSSSGANLGWKNKDTKDGGPVTSYSITYLVESDRHQMRALEKAATKVGRFIALNLKKAGHDVVDFDYDILSGKRIALT